MYTGGSYYNDVDRIVRNGWAEAIEGYFTWAEYSHVEWELKQNQTFTYMRSVGKGYYTPVFIDMVDTNNQRVSYADADKRPDMPLDCVSGYALYHIEACLKDAKTIGDVKQKIKVFSNRTSYFVDELLSQYESLEPAPSPARVSVQPGFALRPGVPLYSASGRYMVVFQHDGNLVVYDTQPAIWVNVWNSGTYNRGGVRCVFQRDNNLVIYNAQNQPVWASKTYWPTLTGELTIEDNGLLAIYPPVRFDPRPPYWAIYDDGSTTF